MNKLRPLVKSCPYAALLVWGAAAHAATVKIEPQVDLGIVVTDNVLLEEDQKSSSTILKAVAGLSAAVEGSQSALSLDYKATQAFYSHDSEANKLFHQLSLSGQKSSTRTGWQANIQGSVRNIPRSTGRNASRNLLTGDLVESRNLTAGVGYSNQSRGPVAVDFSLSSGVQDSEDSYGDSANWKTTIQLGQGRRVKNYFWGLSYSRSEYDSRRTSRVNSSQTMNYQVGFKLFDDLSPMLTAYAEKYAQNDDSSELDRERKMVRVGPGLRYNFSKRSHLQVTYDKVLEGAQKSSWGAQLNWLPSRRTTVTFNYGVRYYGETYDFSLSHQNRKWTNSIRYSEGPQSFGRSLFFDDENIEDLAVTKTLTWTSSLALRRSSFSFSANARSRDSGGLGDVNIGSNDTYGGSVSYQRQLSAASSLSLGLNYNEYSFGQTSGQKDKYYTFDASMRHALLDSLSVDYGFSLTSRSSSRSDYGYDENQLFVNLKKQF